jgi:hypothetical protein
MDKVQKYNSFNPAVSDFTSVINKFITTLWIVNYSKHSFILWKPIVH